MCEIRHTSGYMMEEMEMEYTKGEWKLSPLQLGVLAEDDPDGKNPIADCTGRNNLEECKANAHLIAAAPEMYEALKVLTKLYAIPSDASYPDYAEYWVNAVKAIAKAEGK